MQFAVELAKQSIDGLEERLGQLRRQRVADRVLDPIRGTGALRRTAKGAWIVVAEMVGQRLQVCHPARQSERARFGEQPIGVSGRREPSLVDGRALVASGSST
jgi:hypothetical protein